MGGTPMHTADERRIPPAGDGFYAAGLNKKEGCGCLGGFYYLGQMVWDPETGEEVEVFFPVACKRCEK
jgi:hypothetical protein